MLPIVISGGGLIGLISALSLAKSLPHKIIVLEKHSKNTQKQSKYIAINYTSIQYLTKLDLLKSTNKTPITKIHIEDNSSFGYKQLRSNDFKMNHFGYVIDESNIKSELYNQISHFKNIELRFEESIQAIKNCHKLIIETTKEKITTELCINAEGENSNISKILNLKSKIIKFNHQIYYSTLSSDQAHNNQAFERFTNQGVIALLPIKKKEYALVWGTNKKISIHKEKILEQLQTQFGYQAGIFTNLQKVSKIPATQSKLESSISDKIIHIGNSAQTLHPVMGQGLNLGLRDVIELNKTLKYFYSKNRSINHQICLQHYSQQRKQDRNKHLWWNEYILHTFNTPNKMITILRNLALMTSNQSSYLDKKIIMFASGNK